MNISALRYSCIGLLGMVVVGEDGSESVEIFCFRKSMAVGNVVIFAGSDVSIVLIFCCKMSEFIKGLFAFQSGMYVVFVIIIEGLYIVCQYHFGHAMKASPSSLPRYPMVVFLNYVLVCVVVYW